MTDSGELRVGRMFALRKQKLGKGSFGTIYLGRRLDTDEEVAIKLVCVSLLVVWFVYCVWCIGKSKNKTSTVTNGSKIITNRVQGRFVGSFANYLFYG